MDFITDYRTETYALETQWTNLPDEVQNRAQMCGIDLMGALILGSRGQQFQVGQRLARAITAAGTVPVVGSDETYHLLGAAIAMGHSSNSFDIDDGFNLIKGHPGTSFVGGTLAAALEKNVSYRDYLTALTVCYEVTIRWAMAMQDHYGYLHSTGAYGAFGTAVGVGRLLGLSREQLNNALSVADFHAPMTPVMRSVEYPSMNKDGVPFGALVGTMAVLETLSGTTGKTHLLELPQYAELLDSLGKRYYMLDLYFKPYTCCRWAHQPILACQTLMRQYRFTHEDVEHVKVHTFASAEKLSKKKPRDTEEAQYNIAFPVASALVFGDVGYLEICDEAVTNPEVLSMMDRLEFVVDPALDAQFPAKRLAWVEITLRDGTVYRSDIFAAPGEHTDPELNLDWVSNKFRRITAPFLQPKKQERLLSLMTAGLDISVRDIVNEINRAIDLT